MKLKKENLPHLYQFSPTFWWDRFEKMEKKASVSIVFHSFSFIFGRIFSKMRPYLSVCFLIVSAGFLILLADSLIVSADAIRILALRKAEWFAPSLLCEDLWLSWKGKNKKIVDVLRPRIFTNEAKEHESESPLQLPIRGSAQFWFSDSSDLSDQSENQMRESGNPISR